MDGHGRPVLQQLDPRSDSVGDKQAQAAALGRHAQQATGTSRKAGFLAPGTSCLPAVHLSEHKSATSGQVQERTGRNIDAVSSTSSHPYPHCMQHPALCMPHNPAASDQAYVPAHRPYSPPASRAATQHLPLSSSRYKKPTLPRRSPTTSPPAFHSPCLPEHQRSSRIPLPSDVPTSNVPVPGA